MIATFARIVKLYNKFYSNKEQIERVIGQQLEWMELPDAPASRVLLLKEGIPKDKKHWDAYFEWFCSSVDAFYVAFSVCKTELYAPKIIQVFPSRLCTR